MSAKGILTNGGFEKIFPNDGTRAEQKLRLYQLSDPTQEKIARAKAAIEKEIEYKGRNYQGNLETFGGDIKEKPYLLRDGTSLCLIKGESKTTPEGIHHVLYDMSQSICSFFQGVNVGGAFNMTGHNLQLHIHQSITSVSSGDKLTHVSE